MADDVIKNLFKNVYRDDYRDSDNFYRILFNNARNLQQRELNQLQTILHEDIKASSSAAYRNGAAAVGGQISCDNGIRYVKLNTNTNPLPTDYESLENEIFEEAISGVKVRIAKVIPAEGTDPATLFVVYTDNNSESGGSDPILLTPGRNIIGQTSGTVLTIQTTNTASNPALGQGTLFTVNSGRFYIEGHFVFTREQRLVLSKYTKTPSNIIVGFIVTEKVVTADDDVRLYDNSGSNYNLAAPGADRYKITLTLSTNVNVPAGAYFIKLAEISKGKIQKDANAIGNTLGSLGTVLETYRKEESGNYAVRNFKVSFKEYSPNDDKIQVTISDGKAYVAGRRIHFRQPITLLEDKPRTTKTINNSASAASYGNYLTCGTLKGAPRIDTLERVTIKDAASWSGNTIGTARVRSVERSGSNYNIYVFDVTMEPGYNFGSARSLGTGSSSFGTNWYADINVEPTGIVELKEKLNNNLFFDLQYTRPKSFSDIILTVQKRTDNQGVTAGSVTFTADSGHVFDDAGSWIIFDTSTGVPESGYSISLSLDLTSATISGLSASNVDIISYQQKSNGQVKTKTLTNRTATIAVNADGSVNLGKADIYRLNSVRLTNSNGTTITGRYILDNGQRDNFYGQGKLVPISGKGAPTSGNVYVDYDYFTHSASGDFFAASSYTGQVDYKDIPSHRQVNGQTIQLRDVLDFRPRKSDAGTDFTGTGSNIFPLPRNTDIINFDIEIYLGIKGRAVISKEGWFGVFLGEPDENPTYPSVPGETTGEVMEIMKFHWNPYLLNMNDMTTRYLDNRRYTMRDIGMLDKRLTELEEITALSLLELETQSLEVLDSDGLNRLKAGITADGFSNHAFSDTSLTDYRASIDPVRKELRPRFNAEALELVYDSASSTNAVLKGDNVYIAHDPNVVWKSQISVSREVSVNPFDIQRAVGQLVLSPSSDNWIDTQKLPDRIIKGDTVTETKPGLTYGDWDFNWSGVPANDEGDYKVGDVVSQTTKLGDKYSNTTQTGAYTNTETVYQKRSTETFVVTGTQNLKENLGTVVKSESSIPYQRAKFVSFKATGLRPNTQYFVFFDDKNITNYVSASAGIAAFTPMATLDVSSPYLAAENRYRNDIGYPAELGGPTDVVTDANGSVSGYILLPNNPEFTFATGKHTILFNDVATPFPASGLSYVQANFESAGVLREVQDEILTTKVVQISGFTEPADPAVVSTEIIDYTPPPVEPVIIDNTITIIKEVEPQPPEVIYVYPADPPVVQPDPVIADPIVVVPVPEPAPIVITPIVQPPICYFPIQPSTPPVVSPPYIPPPPPFEPTCFMPWAMVTMEDGSKKPISEVQIGDKVFGGTCKHCGGNHTNEVVGIETPKLGTRTVYSINGRKAFMSEEHPVKTTEGWACVNKATLLKFEFNTFVDVVKEELRSIKELKIGDILITKDGEEEIKTLVPSEHDHDQALYNLLLNGNNTYYVEDILVHNKCGNGPGPAGPGCGNAGGTCFVAGTEVTMADGSIKLIENVQIGDELLGIDGKINKVFKFDHPLLGNRKLYGFNGGKAFVTSEHPFMTTEGWKSIDIEKTKEENAAMAPLMVGNLQPGDQIVKADGTYLTIESIDEHDGNPDQQLYNFLLDGEDHTYVADGMIVHNKGGGKIICTEMYRQTQLEDWSRAMKVWTLYHYKYMTPAHQEGYHWMFMPVVNKMKKSSTTTKVAAYFAEKRTKHLKHILSKGKSKDDIVGNILCKVAHPTVYAAGMLRRALIKLNIIKG